MIVVMIVKLLCANFISHNKCDRISFDEISPFEYFDFIDLYRINYVLKIRFLYFFGGVIRNLYIISITIK